MNDENRESDVPSIPPDGGRVAKISRATLQAIGGAIPLAGGVLSAIAGAWSEQEQDRVNRFFLQWLEMLKDELKEKAETIVEIMARLDLQDEKISERVESKEYQSLLRKAFRDWGASESEKKREYVRNILSNAAASRVTSDDVVRMFLTWLDEYSELHFDVIAAIYNSRGITRGQIWDKLGRQRVPEASADADLYKLLIRDLSTGGIIRQHREQDYYGNFVAKKPSRQPSSTGGKAMVSAFDNSEQYELTELGSQFVHYAMTDLPPKLSFD